MVGLISFISNLIAQESHIHKAGALVGVWQYETSGMASGWDDSYQFFEDGKFIFNFSQMVNKGTRIIQVLGNYRFSNDTLYFVAKTTSELVGGHIKRGRPDCEWLIEGGKRESIEEKQPIEEFALISKCKSKTESADCITIDGVPFYKVSSNPLDYDK